MVLNCQQNECFPTNQSEPNTTHQRLDEKLYIQTENVYKHVQIRVILGTRKRRERWDFDLVEDPTFGGLFPQQKEEQSNTTGNEGGANISDDRVLRKHSGGS